MELQITSFYKKLTTLFLVECPGTGSENAGNADACQGCPNQAVCATTPKGPDPDLVAIAQRLSTVKNIILVLSGKGGVGKSTFSTQLAFSLAEGGSDVGLLDIDICGPSLPKMMGLEGEEIHQSNSGWSPVYVQENLGVMSIGFMLPSKDDAVIWRGPRKNALIKQFLKDVDWGDSLDYLIIDSPPGTSDEHISVAQFLSNVPSLKGAVVVTTPQEVAIIDVRKEINFCKKTGVRILGVVENMSGFRQRVQDFRFLDAGGCDITQSILDDIGIDRCSGIYAETDVFFASGGGAEAMAEDMSVPFLGKIPLDGDMSRASEQGKSVFETKNTCCAPALQKVIQALLRSI